MPIIRTRYHEPALRKGGRVTASTEHKGRRSKATTPCRKDRTEQENHDLAALVLCLKNRWPSLNLKRLKTRLGYSYKVEPSTLDLRQSNL